MKQCFSLTLLLWSSCNAPSHKTHKKEILANLHNLASEITELSQDSYKQEETDKKVKDLIDVLTTFETVTQKHHIASLRPDVNIEVTIFILTKNQPTEDEWQILINIVTLLRNRLIRQSISCDDLNRIRSKIIEREENNKTLLEWRIEEIDKAINFRENLANKNTVDLLRNLLLNREELDKKFY